MPVRLTDQEIKALIAEPKQLPANYMQKLSPREKAGHRERDLTVYGASGAEFRIILRESRFNPMDFSAIIGYALPSTGKLFRLRRYNGKAHEHTNKIEKEKFYDYHIHYATERYQTFGTEEEDSYAVVTSRYGEIGAALDCLITDCGLVQPPGTAPDFLEGAI